MASAGDEVVPVVEEVEDVVEEVKSDEIDDDETALAKMRGRLMAALADKKVSDLKITRTPIVLDAALPVEAAIKILLEHKLRCAPVTSDAKWEGVLDVRDCLKFAVEAYRASHVDASDETSMGAYFTDAVHSSTDNVRYLARMRPLNAIFDTESVLELLKVLSKGAHIICIVQADAADKLKFKGIVSQGEVYGQLSEMLLPLWPEIAEVDVAMQLLADANYVTSPVISILASQSAHEAFEKMSKKGLSGLAVVDENGAIIHNTSSTDIKLWLQSSASLDLTIEDFLAAIRRSTDFTGKDRFPVSYVTLKDMLSKTMQKLHRTRYHRMWIVDDAKKPIGVIALTDIFRYLTSS